MAQVSERNIARLAKIQALIINRVKSPADARQIALMCLDAEVEGGPSGVWHMSAQFYGTRCNCAPCVRSR